MFLQKEVLEGELEIEWDEKRIVFKSLSENVLKNINNRLKLGLSN